MQQKSSYAEHSSSIGSGMQLQYATRHTQAGWPAQQSAQMRRCISGRNGQIGKVSFVVCSVRVVGSLLRPCWALHLPTPFSQILPHLSTPTHPKGLASVATRPTFPPPPPTTHAMLPPQNCLSLSTPTPCPPPPLWPPPCPLNPKWPCFNPCKCLPLQADTKAARCPTSPLDPCNPLPPLPGRLPVPCSKPSMQQGVEGLTCGAAAGCAAAQGCLWSAPRSPLAGAGYPRPSCGVSVGSLSCSPAHPNMV